jgi:hypothetical protein
MSEIKFLNKKDNFLYLEKSSIPKQIRLRNKLNCIIKGLILNRNIFSIYIKKIIDNFVLRFQPIENLILKPPPKSIKLRQSKIYIEFNSRLSITVKSDIISDLFYFFKLTAKWEDIHLIIYLPLGFKETIQMFIIFNNRNNYKSSHEYLKIYNKTRKEIYNIIKI